MRHRTLLVSFVLVLEACGVPAPPSSTGGVHLEPNGGCPGALVVVSSDYATTNVSVLSPAGELLSESFVSSASAPAGLTTALSGDVVVPWQPPPSGRLVLVDRNPNAVITWLDPPTARVIDQLSVGTGFAANPQDYLEVAATKAYVSRYQSNPNPGSEPNDGGGDLLILDTASFAVVGRIDLALAGDGKYLPRPSRLLRLKDEAWVSLERLDADFGAAADARIVGVESATDSIAWSLDLAGLANCGAMALDAAGERVAVACSGLLNGTERGVRAGVVLLDATVEPPAELARFALADELGSPPAPSIAWASDSSLLGVTYGDLPTGVSDSVYALDVPSGTARVLLDAGAGFVLGDTLCSPGCTNVCFTADARAKALRSFEVNGADVVAGHAVTVDPRIGLPPRSLGFLIAPDAP
jgi:hypothetical protein